MRVIRLPPPPEHEEVVDVADKVGNVVRDWTKDEGVVATSMVVVVTLSDGSLLMLRAGHDLYRIVGGLADAQNALLNGKWSE